jgi:Integrase core domain
MQNGFFECSNRGSDTRFRHEFLNETPFSTLGPARQKIPNWLHDYSYHRPYSSLTNIQPVEFMQRRGWKCEWRRLRNQLVDSPKGGRRVEAQATGSRMISALVLMVWMPPPGGIALCQANVLLQHHWRGGYPNV